MDAWQKFLDETIPDKEAQAKLQIALAEFIKSTVVEQLRPGGLLHR
jgi:hypothetical protein